MGKGKGAIDRLIIYIKKGQILFEIKIKNLIMNYLCFIY